VPSSTLSMQCSSRKTRVVPFWFRSENDLIARGYHPIVRKYWTRGFPNQSLESAGVFSSVSVIRAAPKRGEFAMFIADVLSERKSAITVPELAGMLSISERQVYKLAATNRIPSFKIGTSVRFDPQAVRQWLQEKELPLPKRRQATSFTSPDVRSLRSA